MLGWETFLYRPIRIGVGVRLSIGPGNKVLRPHRSQDSTPVRPDEGIWSLRWLCWLGWGQLGLLLLLLFPRHPLWPPHPANAIAQAAIGQVLRSAGDLDPDQPQLREITDPSDSATRVAQISDRSKELSPGPVYFDPLDLALLSLGGITLGGTLAITKLRRDLIQLSQKTPHDLSTIQELRSIQVRLQQQDQDLGQAIAAHNHQVDSTETIVQAKQQAERAIQNATQAIQDTERAMQEAEQAKQQADQANRAKSNFLAQMSHELRTPLNAVLGFSQLMRHDPSLSPKNREHLEIVSRSGQHLLGLINDVLELSKIEAGYQNVELKSVTLVTLGDSLIGLFRLRAEAKGLALRWERSPEVPLQAFLDEQKVRQILINLLENAIKFTSHGQITLRLSIEPDPSLSDSSHLLCFEVEDSGPGLTPEEITHLFLPFSQTELGRQSHQGSGLGLCISRGFAELMGGRLDLYPALPHGSIFRLSLPTIAQGPAAPIKSLRIPRRLSSGQQPPHILVVDDRRINRSLICQFLNGVGFITREASNGQEAIEQWQLWQPDLILMDLEMPILDGRRAAAAILQQTPSSIVPPVMIAITTSAFDSDTGCIALRDRSSPDLQPDPQPDSPQAPPYFHGLIRKPIEAALLFETIHQHLGIQYEYDDSGRRDGHDEGRRDRPESIASSINYSDWLFPPDWLDHLEQAAIELDIPRLETLVLAIESCHGELAKTLTEQIKNFDFDQILHCVSLAKRSG